MEQRVPTSIEQVLDPQRTALLLWDMQEGVASRAHNRVELVPVVRSLLEAARSAEVAVMWAVHVPAKREFTPGSKLRANTAGTSIAGSDDARPEDPKAILSGFQALDTEWIIEKPTQSFFVGTDIEIGLRALAIDSVVIAGVATEMGVEFTARHAAALGFFTTVVEDGVGSFSEAGHEIGMAYFRSDSALYIDLVPSPTIIAAWSR